MKCISCSVEINPKWKHAINSNICPFCGSFILEEHLKNLLNSLNDIMDKLNEYPSQLDDWMLSNYNYIKTDSSNLVEYVPKEYFKEIKKIEDERVFEEKKSNKFIVKVKTDAGEQEVEAEKIQAEDRTNEFFKRAEAVKPNIDGFKSTAEKTQHLKAMAQQIKRAGSVSIDNFDRPSAISPEMMESSDPEMVEEIESLFSENEVSSSLSDGLGDENIPSVVLNMAKKAKSGSGKSNPADLLKLQQMRDKLNDSRSNFESGANRGKGGFSRV